MSLARKILSNTAWQILGKAVTAILGIISIKLITNYLTPSMYGQYTGIYDYTALFAIVADAGLFTIAVREMAQAGEDREKVSRIMGNILSLRALLAFGAFGAGAGLAFWIPAYRGTPIPTGVLIVSIATILTLISGTMWSVLQFYLRMHWASIAITAGKIAAVGYIALSIFYLFPKDPATGFLHLQFAWIIGALFTVVITYFAVRACLNAKADPSAGIRFRFETHFWKTVLLKALPYGSALVLGTVYFRMGTIMLLFFRLEADAGKYGVALRFLEILQLVPHYFMGSVLPTLTNRLAEDNLHGSRRGAQAVRYSLNAMGALAMPILVGGILLSWQLAAAVSNPQFLSARGADGIIVWGADRALAIVLVGMACAYFHVVFNYTLVAFGKQKEILKINAVAVVINIILNIIIIPRFGFIGAAMTAAVTEFSMLIGLSYMARKYIRGFFDAVFLGKTAVSATAMGGVIWLVRDVITQSLGSAGLVVIIPVGMMIFGGMMLMTKAVSREMSALLKKTEPSGGENPM